jgi:hypothetical protein
MQMLCRKAALTYLLNRVRDLFPSLYTFYPQSFILPDDLEQFQSARAITSHPYVVKPDGGSLGVGIEYLQPDSSFVCSPDLCVGQQYIDSYIIDNRKFDLRVYCLVASLHPLRIYVYRDGIARFCAEEITSTTKYARITNIGLNKSHEGVEMSDISRLIHEVFSDLEDRGIDTAKIWRRIDELITLTIFSGVIYLEKGEANVCPCFGYPRCFQLLGFDILLDTDLKPWLLEVNYRPSLDFYRAPERRMKVGMLRDLMRITTPYNLLQEALLARKWAWSRESWVEFVRNEKDLLTDAGERKQFAADLGDFVQVWPASRHHRQLLEPVLRTCKGTVGQPLPGYIVDIIRTDTTGGDEA